MRKRYSAIRRLKKHTVSVVIPLNNPFDNQVLLLYNKSDKSYDSET